LSPVSIGSRRQKVKDMPGAQSAMPAACEGVTYPAELRFLPFDIPDQGLFPRTAIRVK